MRPLPLVTAGVATLALTLAACGGSSPPSRTTTSTITAPETVAPGDIPDNQVFVAYTPPGSSFSLQVPEGWARSTGSGPTTFTDKYNSIEVQSKPEATAPTVQEVKASGVADVSGNPTFELGKVATINRKAGPGVLATFTIGSAPNSVTGKRALLAVERYEFGHNGTTVVLTLSGAKGADNVDPWRIVSDSLTWK